MNTRERWYKDWHNFRVGKDDCRVREYFHDNYPGCFPPTSHRDYEWLTRPTVVVRASGNRSYGCSVLYSQCWHDVVNWRTSLDDE